MRRLFSTFALLLVFGCERVQDSTATTPRPPEAPPGTPLPTPELPTPPTGQPQAPREAPVSSQTTAQTLPQLADLAEKLVPSVVSIQVEVGARRTQGQAQGQDPFDFFRGFGRGLPEAEPRGRGLGSGFLIDQSGLILTNNHVVEDATNIEVTFATADGVERTMKATLVGTAPEYDVALVKTVEPPTATPMVLGDSEAVRIGDWVLAIGNPFGLEHSVSVGIISAKQRRDVAPSGRTGLYDFLQTDASINPGNSGGPLINMRGEVIGINSAINAQGQGIGFAIPINMVKGMLPQLREGRFTRSWIGVRIQPLTRDLAESFGMKDEQGVLVAEVVERGPGAAAGLHQGDVILEFDGKKLVRSSDLPLYASMAGVGKSVPVVIWRGNERKVLSVKLEAFPEDAARAKAQGNDESQDSGESAGSVGLSVVDLTAGLRDQLKAKAAQGAVVQDIAAGSVAARAGFQRGDVIVNVQGKAVSNARDVIATVKAVKSGTPLRFQIERQGVTIFVALAKP